MFIKVRDVDDIIVETRSTVAFPPEGGHTMYSDLPDNHRARDEFDGISYNAYVDPADWPTRYVAWEDAINDWLDNGIMTNDTKWKRCVKLGTFSRMDDASWTAIVLAYP